jgi:hypothetical protein
MSPLWNEQKTACLFFYQRGGSANAPIKIQPLQHLCSFPVCLAKGLREWYLIHPATITRGRRMRRLQRDVFFCFCHSFFCFDWLKIGSGGAWASNVIKRGADPHESLLLSINLCCVQRVLCVTSWVHNHAFIQNSFHSHLGARAYALPIIRCGSNPIINKIIIIIDSTGVMQSEFIIFHISAQMSPFASNLAWKICVCAAEARVFYIKIMLISAIMFLAQKSTKEHLVRFSWSDSQSGIHLERKTFVDHHEVFGKRIFGKTLKNGKFLIQPLQQNYKYCIEQILCLLFQLYF